MTYLKLTVLHILAIMGILLVPSNRGFANGVELPKEIIANMNYYVIDITIDIIPHKKENTINTAKNISISVAIFGKKDFDTSSIYIKTLRFGATGDEESLISCEKSKYLNLDFRKDILCYFSVKESALDDHSKNAIISGYTVEGRPFEGSGSIKVINRKSNTD